MATIRKIAFRNEYLYHIFNRGVERRDVFLTKRDYQKALETLKYYQFVKPPIKLSRFLKLPDKDKQEMLIKIGDHKLVSIICFCLMPNHFHFLLKQLKDNGISIFLSNFTNSYVKYFNTKQSREGSLFQGPFKAVFVESDEQLVHLSRYIHLNPTTSSLIREDQLENYPYSSYPEYLSKSQEGICTKELVLDLFKSVDGYKQFVNNQISYAKELDKIKHLILD